jgi:hypothetical protein
MSTTFPLFYRVVFVIFDIALPIFGTVMHTFNPAFILSGFTPTPTVPAVSETLLLMDTLAGWYASLALMNIVMLKYRRNDMLVWRTMVAGTLLLDVFMLAGFAKALRREGRVAVGSWTGDDWSNVGGYTVITLVRSMFLLGVGMGRGKMD